MPNICENWVHFAASPETIDAIMYKPFTLTDHFPEPEGLSDEETYNWLNEQFNTKWICNETRNGPAIPEQKGTNTMIVNFISAWFVPHGFYKKLVERYPDLRIDYEYHCWESGFIGHGQMHSGDFSEPERQKTDDVHFLPNHCSYDTLEELNDFVNGKGDGWHVDTCNPQLEYAAEQVKN